MKLLVIISLFVGLNALSASLADSLIVREIVGSSAVLEGKTMDLKAGDKVYFGRPPFQFIVDSVKDNKITIRIQKPDDLKIGSILLHEPTEAIKKSIQTESRLKEALGE